MMTVEMPSSFRLGALFSAFLEVGAWSLGGSFRGFFLGGGAPAPAQLPHPDTIASSFFLRVGSSRSFIRSFSFWNSSSAASKSAGAANARRTNSAWLSSVTPTSFSVSAGASVSFFVSLDSFSFDFTFLETSFRSFLFPLLLSSLSTSMDAASLIFTVLDNAFLDFFVLLETIHGFSSSSSTLLEGVTAVLVFLDAGDGSTSPPSLFAPFFFFFFLFFFLTFVAPCPSSISSASFVVSVF
mmetsp:Transcript_37379/g.78296  ORF Transcript_37379/g.78296 Transcript_37379/m.78296 type:complete len:240 (+) Transcript_37379:303-1022(+)